MTPRAPDDRPWYAHRFDATYAELYAHRDDAEAARATTAILAPLGLVGRRVLDLGCGPGRWSRAVARFGALPVGLDLSAALLRLARAGGVVRLVRGDMRDLPFLDARFDVVLCMFTTFGYFASVDDDLRALDEMHRVLRPGGDLVLDQLNAVRARRELVPETRRRIGRFEVWERRQLDVPAQRIVKEIELRDGDERHAYREEVRLWDADALLVACNSAGFDVVNQWGDYDGGAFDAEQAARLILRARRRV